MREEEPWPGDESRVSAFSVFGVPVPSACAFLERMIMADLCSEWGKTRPGLIELYRGDSN